MHHLFVTNDVGRMVNPFKKRRVSEHTLFNRRAGCCSNLEGPTRNASHHTTKPSCSTLKLSINSVSRTRGVCGGYTKRGRRIITRCVCMCTCILQRPPPSKREGSRDPQRSLAPGHTPGGPKTRSRLEGYPQGPLWSQHQESAKKTNLIAASLPRPGRVDGGKGCW